MDVLKMANNGLNNDEFNAIKSLITENKIRILNKGIFFNWLYIRVLLKCLYFRNSKLKADFIQTKRSK